MTKKQKIVYYTLLVIVSILFLTASIFKLIGNNQDIAGFTATGLPIWFMYVIGIGEICGVIGLWTKPFFRIAYEGLFVVLIGAFGTTLAFMGILPALFPVVVAIMLGIVVRLRVKPAV